MSLSKCINCAHESPRSALSLSLGSSFPLPFMNSAGKTEWTTSTYARALKTIFFPMSLGLRLDGQKIDREGLPEAGDGESLCSSCAAILETLFSLYAQLTAITKVHAGARVSTWAQFFQILKQRSAELLGYESDNDTQTSCIKLDLDALYPNWELTDDTEDYAPYAAIDPGLSLEKKLQKEALTRPCFIRIQPCDGVTFKRESSKSKARKRRQPCKVKKREVVLEHLDGSRVRKPVNYAEDEPDAEPAPDLGDGDPDFVFGEEELDLKLSESDKVKLKAARLHKSKSKSTVPKRKRKPIQNNSIFTREDQDRIFQPEVVFGDLEQKLPESYKTQVSKTLQAYRRSIKPNPKKCNINRNRKPKDEAEASTSTKSTRTFSINPQPEQYRVLRDPTGKPEFYECLTCNHRVTSQSGMKNHIICNHSGVKSFMCETCGKAFFTTNKLTKHRQRAHTEGRPHICDICGKGFRSTWWLADHKKLHGEDKPYLCPICGKTYAINDYLVRHIKTHSKVKGPKVKRIRRWRRRPPEFQGEPRKSRKRTEPNSYWEPTRVLPQDYLQLQQDADPEPLALTTTTNTAGASMPSLD